jgi:hypothetical protein
MARGGTGSDAADWVPDVLMCVAVKSGLAAHKVMVDKLTGSDIESWWACAACEVKAAATPSSSRRQVGAVQLTQRWGGAMPTSAASASSYVGLQGP